MTPQPVKLAKALTVEEMADIRQALTGVRADFLSDREAILVACGERLLATIADLTAKLEVRSSEEAGWVIEHYDSQVSVPAYFACISWSTDNLRAVRFARKEDAQRMSNYLFPGEPHRIADHMWCGP